MADDRGRREPSVGPDPAEGVRPSPRARERFAADLRSEVEATRVAWYDAMLRGRERLRAGDDHGAMEAIEDQRRLLQLLERRLERVVASAAVEREAEGVLAGVEASMTTDASPRGGTVTPPRPVDAEAPRAGAGGRLRALVAAGAAAAVTALAVGLGALVGPLTTPAPEVAGPVEGTAHEADAEAVDPASQQDVGTAEQTSPLPVDPPTSAPWFRDWTELWPSGHGAGDDAPADARPPQREEAAPQDADQRADAGPATDTPSPPSDDRTAQDDVARDEDDEGSDADEGDPEDQGGLLDLRRLIQPGDDAGEDEELPGADADATASLDDPDDDLEGRDDGSEETAGVSRRLGGRP